MCMKVMELLRQNICVRDEVKLVAAEAFLHFHVVVAKAVLARDFITLRKVVDPLVLV